MNTKLTIECKLFPDWYTAHSFHKHDFLVYMFDVLPIDALCCPNITAYIGSAGANSSRTTETKTSNKSVPYIKASLDARYRGGSYTKNHTRPQELYSFTISRNQPLVGESTKEWLVRSNTEGFKQEERKILGVLEFHLWSVANALGVPLNNTEPPKCDHPEYKNLTTEKFFNSVEWIGDIPMIVLIAQRKTTLDAFLETQKTFKIQFAQSLLS